MPEEQNTVYLQISSFARPFIILGALIGLSLYFNSPKWEHLSVWEYCAFAAWPVLLVFAILVRKRMFIRIDDESLTIHYVTGSERKYALRDITKVSIVSFRRPMPSVVLRLRDDASGLTAQNKAYRAVRGYDVMIPPYFGPAKNLAARIEEARVRKGAPVELV